MRERGAVRQKQILAYLKSYTKEHGYQPTLRETAEHFGFRSSQTVGYHLEQLERAGFITRSGGHGKARRVAIHRVGSAPGRD